MAGARRGESAWRKELPSLVVCVLCFALLAEARGGPAGLCPALLAGRREEENAREARVARVARAQARERREERGALGLSGFLSAFFCAGLTRMGAVPLVVSGCRSGCLCWCAVAQTGDKRREKRQEEEKARDRRKHKKEKEKRREELLLLLVLYLSDLLSRKWGGD